MMSFFNPWFLIGAASLAVPIIVHLVRRQQATRVPFPSLMFLRRIPQKTIRRRRLRHLFLLALRCLALLLLALAFARPFIPGEVEGGADGPGRNIVVLLDASYSMRQGNRFDQAREQARSLIAAATPKDRIALMTFSQGYHIVHPPTQDHQAILAELGNLRPTVEATDFVQALRGAQSLLGEANDGENEVVLISDFQASGWDRSDESFSLKARLTPIDVADSSNANIACVDVGVNPVVYTSKYEQKLLAKLTNFSHRPQSVAVRLKLNDRLTGKTTIRLDEQASRVVEFTGFRVLNGSNRGVIEIGDDPLPIDNQFFFVIEKTEPLAVLCLESVPGESFYLRQALAVSQNNPYTMMVKPAGQMSLEDLEKVKIVILNDVGRLDETIVAGLRRWVEGGGGLILAPGRRVDVGAFNQTFSQLAPAKLEKRVAPRGGGFEFLSQLNTRHPVFAPFADARSGNFSTARFYGYFRATPGETALVLARLSSGDPALLEQSVGRGKVLLFTSSLDKTWNELPLSPMYVPLLHQMLHQLYTVRTRGWRRLGETIQVADVAPDSPVPVDSPTEKRLIAGDDVSSDGTLFTARENGFYRLRYPEGEKYIAVNLDFRESNLKKLDVDDLVAAFGNESEPPAAPTETGPAGLLPDQQEPGRKLWWPMLAAALALFMLEAVLADRIGHRTSSARREAQKRGSSGLMSGERSRRPEKAR